MAGLHMQSGMTLSLSHYISLHFSLSLYLYLSLCLYSLTISPSLSPSVLSHYLLYLYLKGWELALSLFPLSVFTYSKERWEQFALVTLYKRTMGESVVFQ